ncbi:HNH endonuclease [Pseudoalteromonas piscicida]|uniref:HNH endonuclease n=1 Tax=Pseudoalteromonas piscicida TaxID=43662 RepID=UPI0027392381|nr:HNH endonuclease [Pseudoalteromonas piscicida]MDP4490045.1 HNH endonuclease [Pseudoalteromonas piscicida]
MSLRRKLPQRSEHEKKYKNYKRYKSDLRKDFNQRCGYCDADDMYLGWSSSFHIDHFAPQKKFKHLQTAYSNLVYACRYCNCSKSDYWPSNCPETSVVDNEGIIDPCAEELDMHLERNSKGEIVPLTPLGSFIFDLLNLGLPRHSVLWKLHKLDTNLNQMDRLSGELNKAQLEVYRALSSEYRRLLSYVGEVKNE